MAHGVHDTSEARASVRLRFSIPERACVRPSSTLFLIWFAVSVMKMAVCSWLALILVLWPCSVPAAIARARGQHNRVCAGSSVPMRAWRAGMNLEWIRDGLGYLSRGATSRVMRKYGS